MHNQKILILDDEQIVIDAIKKHLRTYGYTIHEAKNGIDGIKLFHEVNPVLIILDLKMPVMDGVEFLQKINLAPTDPYSVIVLTGHGSDEDMERCFELGVSAFLHKPFNLYELKGLVKNSIALKHVEKDLKRQLDARNKMEGELWKYRYMLEDLVEKRTLQLKTTNDKLHVEINERLKTEERLKQSLREKEVLLREVHHRVKNNLQIVSSLLDLQARYITNEESLEMFRDSQRRLKAMALIHEKLYQADNVERIDFRKYVENLLNHLYASYCLNTDRISMNANIDECYIGLDTAVPCGLIINEIVSNSLKHAFTADVRGSINVELKVQPGNAFVLTIGDTGSGIAPGIEIKDAQTLGLRLVNALVTDQLEGSIQCETNPGTTFKISFGEMKYSRKA
ncbi:MAG: histidine kinase dimerization/phosphoacceptor domain -containing protein [Candidatus Magnetobacterium sp. LHC-1]|uniref:Response regulator n=1 Tax=Candidatus Magnetobacterium casense TaxID=1455061 RepID=A0ABS6RX88_9BACT|nr:response regulator [Candidatus Magnetobacterium casensis]MBF0606389.1 response regulator [Nitrospirota bacterium]MBV6341201.1 response regulator [Candidatus Magnetobacterium casensis]